MSSYLICSICLQLSIHIFVKRKDEDGMHGGIAHSSRWMCGRFDLKTTQKCGVGWGGLRQREPYFGAKVH